MARIHAGVRDIRAGATRYLAGNDEVAIERDGRTGGVNIPVPERDEETGQRALADLRSAIHGDPPLRRCRQARRRYTADDPVDAARCRSGVRVWARQAA
jgi:hypothetical protein